ncbi:hypothetical protein OB955_24335 [Halobacteria archaeon AArc-m2/3/4]|uniref:Uncharacterized protein n=1 Tax=Natronoglomus mannanivorans TaxID=2979990 RepID=A0AAP2Z3D0_9EURY|nr:hypothetical protein [Halobacteria archaeon AArc-xg1-1]MCU4975813.1 hypothetical protein [Halobacteria archaeon AArc-m2/3/4]
MTDTVTDFGTQMWFRAIIGILWIVVAGLVAVGLYSLQPTVGDRIVSSEYLLGTAVFGLAILSIGYALSVTGRRRRPKA